jgi:hypothetical protein
LACYCCSYSFVVAAAHIPPQGFKAERERVESAKADYLRQMGAFTAKAKALGKSTVRVLIAWTCERAVQSSCERNSMFPGVSSEESCFQLK